jgi:hypothetical protein
MVNFIDVHVGSFVPTYQRAPINELATGTAKSRFC